MPHHSDIVSHFIFVNTQNTKSQLIQYQRPDTEGPKLSQFLILETDEPDKLHQMLEASIGIKGEVIKIRHLFIYNQTRIHIDDVKNLGTFLEFEVCKMIQYQNASNYCEMIQFHIGLPTTPSIY